MEHMANDEQSRSGEGEPMDTEHRLDVVSNSTTENVQEPIDIGKLINIQLNKTYLDSITPPVILDQNINSVMEVDTTSNQALGESNPDTVTEMPNEMEQNVEHFDVTQLRDEQNSDVTQPSEEQNFEGNLQVQSNVDMPATQENTNHDNGKIIKKKYIFR